MAALYIHIDDLGLGHTIRVWIWDAQKAHMGVMEHCYDDLTTSRRCVLGGGGATTMFLQLAQHLNRATGDDAIDILKRRVVEQGAPLLLPTLSMLPHVCQDGC